MAWTVTLIGASSKSGRLVATLEYFDGFEQLVREVPVSRLDLVSLQRAAREEVARLEAVDAVKKQVALADVLIGTVLDLTPEDPPPPPPENPDQIARRAFQAEVVKLEQVQRAVSLGLRLNDIDAQKITADLQAVLDREPMAKRWL